MFYIMLFSPKVVHWSSLSMAVFQCSTCCMSSLTFDFTRLSVFASIEDKRWSNIIPLYYEFGCSWLLIRSEIFSRLLATWVSLSVICFFIHFLIFIRLCLFRWFIADTHSLWIFTLITFMCFIYFLPIWDFSFPLQQLILNVVETISDIVFNNLFPNFINTSSSIVI